MLEKIYKNSESKLHEKLTKATVVYMDSKQGPFRCDKCDFWHSPNSCELVEGEIDPAGCCNDFKKTK